MPYLPQQAEACCLTTTRMLRATNPLCKERHELQPHRLLLVLRSYIPLRRGSGGAHQRSAPRRPLVSAFLSAWVHNWGWLWMVIGLLGYVVFCFVTDD